MSGESTIPCLRCKGDDDGCQNCQYTGLAPFYHQKDIDRMMAPPWTPSPRFWALEREKHGRILRKPEGGEQSHKKNGLVEDHHSAKMSKLRQW